MADDILVRLYEPHDREAVRRICCDTAERGEPVEGYFQDREVVADLLTSYYTDYEPRSVWVAEHAGRVIGYLTGCLNSRRYWTIMAWKVAPRVMLKAIRRGDLWLRQTWRLLRTIVKTCLRGGFYRHIPSDLYPGHLHVNIEGEFRGHHVGSRLVERFCEQAKATGLKGVYASVRGDNPSGKGFFEQMGFTVLSRHLMIRPTEKEDQASYTVLYVKRF